MLGVLVVNDQQVPVGTARPLEDIDGIEVAGRAGSSAEAIKKKVADRAPDVVLVDIQMPGIGGLEATRRSVVTMFFYGEVK